jgi:dTDP-4-amino-4,6-dideoxygalactose transaminase
MLILDHGSYIMVPESYELEEKLSQTIVSLPIHPYFTKMNIDSIISIVS